MPLGAQAAVDVEQRVGNRPLGCTLVHHAAQDRHGLVVGGTGSAHELLLLGVLDCTRMVDGGRTQTKPAGSARVAQGQQKTGSEVLVAAQGGRMVGKAADERERVVLVAIPLRSHREVGRRGEQVVHHEHRLMVGPQNEPVESLAGIDIEAREPADAHGVTHEHLGKAELIKIAAHLLQAICIVCRHDTPSSFSFRICVRLFS